MQTQQLHRYEQVESFLASIRNVHSKQEFLSRVQQFDSRFTEEQAIHHYPEKQKSIEKLPPAPQEKPKNPFKTNLEDNNRQRSFIQQNMTAQNSPFSQPQPPTRTGYSRTEQNFYKNQAGKAEGYGNPLNNSFGYGTPNGLTPQGAYGAQGNYGPQGSYGSGGMGVLNYNAYSQKEYDELRQEFFRAPPSRPDPYARVQENYRAQGEVYNFNPMNLGLGISSSTELLAEPSSAKPSARMYGEKANPFMRQ